ncbi:emp24/gp25L/p24 family/GOLD-domain-containing protein [Lobosporangium transversale]|uniref:Emp24/gp25L/p24 family/GOLD-domain-containing protein n=1 Tax=Lobosporangium transversale TaxID=64571 RepID=A0A1Y2G7N9_9FUNG|nr:emp24/gp25L/p24 family/GOLD-domain-containing protein [Lobosporangium transversale]ORZ01833.1 emp24/gp25L/p24 family/GOLD-domain-containing protein [Lobosporangium transversale]|eukprot:XP_021876130.1 emp24/gp25L/p24 family/GOLD-domain-containing protein [Lobosporangium transversale]
MVYVVTVFLVIAFLSSVQGIKFELPAQVPEDAVPFCISHYVDDETHVVVKVKVGPGPHQKTLLEITDDSEHQNQLWRKDSLSEGRQLASFLTKRAGDVFACFTNVLADGYKPDSRYTRVVDIDFDIGSETIDYEKLAREERLKPMELELRKLEDLVKDIIANMEHLKEREEKMRNTNESTNERVKYFSSLTMFILVGLGLWQIFYLKRFFRKKRLID